MADETPLSAGGQALWNAITKEHTELTVGQKAILLEACRAKDRADVVAGKLLQHPGSSPMLSLANRTGDSFKQLMAAVRLPEPGTGRVPQRRNGPRLTPAPAAGTSALDRARAKAEPSQRTAYVG